MLSGNLFHSSQRTKEEHESMEEEGEEIGFNLGLSLEGRFSVDKSSSNKLWRSSSVACSLPTERDDKDASKLPVALARVDLIRTSSLPVYSDAERWKRRELHTVRRMEAKRRMGRRQRNLKGTKQGDESVMSLKGRLGRENLIGVKSFVGKQFDSSGILEGGLHVIVTEGKGNCADSSSGEMAFRGSSEGSYSTSSDLESKISQVSSGELSPASILPSKERIKEDFGLSKPKAVENLRSTTGSLTRNQGSLDPSRTRGSGTKEITKDCMPSVFTRGDGPNGKRVDGILYRQGEGELSIMCVCHGNFYSPAEFVIHAGSTCMDNPLKRIVINPNSFSLL